MTLLKHGQVWSRACATIESLIGECQRSGISHLPNIRELARRCDVSPVTMRRALHRLEKIGIVTIRNRIGVFINVPCDVRTVAPVEIRVNFQGKCTNSSNALSDSLARDIQAGRFRLDSPLPSIKELCLLYSVSYPTLHKALQVILSTGLVYRHGRGYRISQVRPRTSRDTIILIARSDNWSEMCTYTPRSAEFWRVMEQECLRTNTVIELRHCTAALGMLRADQTPGHGVVISRPGAILGYMVWTLGLHADEIQQLGVLLGRQRAPVAFLDEIGNVQVPPVISRNPMVKYYSMATSSLPGEVLGRYLLGLGHRRIAFFLSDTSHQFYHNRLSGIANIFKRASIPEALALFSLPGLPDFEPFGQRLSDDLPYRELNRHREDFAEFYGSRCAGQEDMFYRVQALHLLTTRFWCGKMEPLFEKALKDKSITAWVGMNDVIALLAQDFLSRRGVAVPGRISVCGFDDTLDALGQGLTSYNFNVPAVVLAMLDHMLRPRMGVDAPWEFPIEIKGTVMERRSSGVARSATALV